MKTTSRDNYPHKLGKQFRFLNVVEPAEDGKRKTAVTTEETVTFMEYFPTGKYPDEETVKKYRWTTNGKPQSVSPKRRELPTFIMQTESEECFTLYAAAFDALCVELEE